MPRTADERLRTELLERAVDYACEYGISDLSLRPLADAIGSSPSLLLYHFGSKDRLLVDIVAAGRRRQQAMMDELDVAGLSTSEAGKLLWRAWTSRRWEPAARLFFELYGIAMQDRSRFPGFLRTSVHDWLRALQSPLAGEPLSNRRATVMLAAFRGFLLDFCATRERARIDAAVDAFLDMFVASA